MFWGMYETKAEKELKKLTAEVAAKAAKEVEDAKKEVTLQDVQVVATKYGQKVLTKAKEDGQKILTQAKEVGSELLMEAGNKTAEIKNKTTEMKNTVVEKFNEKSGKAVIAVVEATYSVSKKLSGLKEKAVKVVKILKK